MKTNLLRIMAFTVVLILMFGAAVVPVSAKVEAKSIVFNSVLFIPSKGYVFKFQVTGNFKTKDILGYVNVGSNRYSLNCGSADSGLLVCSPSDSLRRYSRYPAQGVVGGFSFNTVIPKPFVLAPKVPANLLTTYCYSIFDYDRGGVWNVIGQYCKDNDPSIDPTIQYYNPVWKDTYTYYYYTDGSSVTCPNPPAPSWGEGYYYDDPDFCS